MRALFIALLIMAFALPACKKGNKDNNSPSGTYSFTMNGQEYKGTANGLYSSSSNDIMLTIAGQAADTTNGTQGMGITIDFSNTNYKPGIYTNQLFSCLGNENYIGSVTVTITKISSTYTEGTFFGTAINSDTYDNVDITNGVFKAPIQQ